MAKKGRSIKVDLSEAESAAALPEDDYAVKVEEVTQEEGQNSGEPYLSWVLKVTKGKFKGRTLYHNTSLQPQALFNLRSTLEALGVEVEEEGPMDIDLDELEGEEMGVSVENEEYKGKDRSRVVSCFPLEDLGKEDEEGEDEDDDEEEEEAPTKKKKKKVKEEEEEEDEDEDEDEEEEDDEDEDEEEEAPKGKKKKKSVSVGDTVSFTDDEDDEQTGKVVRIDKENDTAVVKVKKEEWEVSLDELTKV